MKRIVRFLDRIRQKYETYIRGKDQVIELYSIGDREGGERLHRDVRKEFFELSDLCKKFKGLNEEVIKNEIADSQSRVRQITMTAVVLMGTNLLLGVFLVVYSDQAGADSHSPAFHRGCIAG